MDKQKDFEKGWEDYKTKRKQQTEEMIGIIQKSVGGCARHWASLIAEELIKYYQPKIPEDAVVLTREEAETIYGTLKANEEFIFDLQEAAMVCKKEMEEAQEVAVKEIVEYVQQARKETAEKFAEKARLKTFMVLKPLNGAFQLGSETEEAIFLSDIDKITKEITEGDNG